MSCVLCLQNRFFRPMAYTLTRYHFFWKTQNFIKIQYSDQFYHFFSRPKFNTRQPSPSSHISQCKSPHFLVSESLPSHFSFQTHFQLCSHPYTICCSWSLLLARHWFSRQPVAAAKRRKNPIWRATRLAFFLHLITCESLNSFRKNKDRTLWKQPMATRRTQTRQCHHPWTQPRPCCQKKQLDENCKKRRPKVSGTAKPKKRSEFYLRRTEKLSPLFQQKTSLNFIHQQKRQGHIHLTSERGKDPAIQVRRRHRWNNQKEAIDGIDWRHCQCALLWSPITKDPEQQERKKLEFSKFLNNLQFSEPKLLEEDNLLYMSDDKSKTETKNTQSTGSIDETSDAAPDFGRGETFDSAQDVPPPE